MTPGASASPVLGADGELIDRFILLLRHLPVPDPGTDWTSDVFLALLYKLDLLDEEDWYDPRSDPDLALDQFRERAMYACQEPDDPVDEVALVVDLLGQVDEIVDGWASSRADDAFGANRDAATRALADREELCRMLADFNRINPDLYSGMNEDAFAEELRRLIREAPFMRPRSVEQVAALMRLQDGWLSGREVALGLAVMQEWRDKRDGS